MTCTSCKHAACVSICEHQYECSNGHKGIQQGTEECPDAEPKDTTLIGKEDWYE